MDTLGFLEVTSIAKGIQVADAMIKASYVELLMARASCPGKYYILIGGDVSSVKSSINEAKRLGESFVVYETIVPKINPKVIAAIGATAMPEKVAAIGVLEFFSIAASITAADTAVKTAQVDIIDIRLGTGIGGKSFVVLSGELSAVKDAIAAGSSTIEGSGMLLNKVVLSNPRKELLESLY